MQRYSPKTVPPAARQPQREDGSPSYNMAVRIYAEQGRGQAERFLERMEPFIAPAERRAIAERLGLDFLEVRPTPAPPTPAAAPQKQGGIDPAMLMQLMGGMSGGRRPDPMTLMQLMMGKN